MNVTQLERDLTAKRDQAASLLKTQLTAVEAENRDRTPEEVSAVQTLLDEGKALQARLTRAKADANLTEEIDRLTAGLTVAPAGRAAGDAAPGRLLSMGQQLVAHPDFQKFIKVNGHRRSGSWSSDAFELEMMKATTLDESSGSGGPLLLPQVLPGILELRFKQLRVSDLIPGGGTDSNAILYLKEKTWTNAAAAVAEGAAKPESTLVFEQATATVQKLAHWLPVTEEMLEDFPAIRAFIDARLRFGLDYVKDDELLNGSGVAPHLNGILTQATAAAQARGADTNMDAILKEITKIATTAFVQPTAIVLNPTNWQTIQLAKNASGNYMGAGPWTGPQTETLWGLPVATTPTIASGTGLTGDFATSAQQFQRGGVRVEISNSHSDFFVKNLVAIRAEERLVVVVYRPAAFGTITGLN